MQGSSPTSRRLGARRLRAARRPSPRRGRPYELVTSDGVTLRGWIHLPPGEGPFATVLECTPYQDNNGNDHSGGPGGLKCLVDAGFAVARVSVRGTGRSGGCLQVR